MQPQLPELTNELQPIVEVPQELTASPFIEQQPEPVQEVVSSVIFAIGIVYRSKSGRNAFSISNYIVLTNFILVDIFVSKKKTQKKKLRCLQHALI